MDPKYGDLVGKYVYLVTDKMPIHCTGPYKLDELKDQNQRNVYLVKHYHDWVFQFEQKPRDDKMISYVFINSKNMVVTIRRKY